MQQQGADFSGWGSKQGSKVKTWKKRFFVLRGRELVYYSGGGGSYGDEKGRLTVVGVDFAPDLKNGLLIRGEKKNKTQVLKMKTATADESKAWLRQIRQAVADTDPLGAHRSASFRSRSVSGTDVSSTSASTSSSSASSFNSREYMAQASSAAMRPPIAPQMPYHSQRSLSEPGAPATVAAAGAYYGRTTSNMNMDEKRGWLLKEGKNVKSWKKRFFVLRGNVLTYYADEKSSPKLGSIVVKDVEANFTTPFTLDVHAEGGRLLRIAADSLDDIESWDLSLSQAISGGNNSSNNAGGGGGVAEAPKVMMLKPKTGSLSSASSYAFDSSFRSFEPFDKVQFRQTSSIDDDSFAATPKDNNAQHHPPAYPAAQSTSKLRTASGSSITCEGWLLKQGRTSKQWKKRYFTLTNDLLEYRHTPEDFPNEDEVVVDVEFDNFNQSWARIELDSGRTITVAAETPDEFKTWATALSEVTGKPYRRDDDDGDGDDDNSEQERELEYKDDDDSGVSFVEAHAIDYEYAEEAPPASPTVTISSPPVVFAPEIKYGWLLKQGSLIKSWKRRYFVLEGDLLQYYEHIDKPARGGGAVSRVVRDGATVGENCLDVHLVNGRILKISSEVHSELESWYDALLNASHLLTTVKGKEEEEELDFGVDSNAANPHRLQKKLGQEGWLLKKGQNFKTWKQRYFVLERSRLMYYDNDEKAGELLGSGVVFEVGVGESRPFCLDVRFQNGRLLQVVAPDQAQFSVWLEALQNASNLTESFLSQHEDDSHEGNSNAVFDDEFDLDFGDDDASGAGDLDWNNNQEDHETQDDKNGFSTWSAAMENKPEWDRSDSYDSSSVEDEDTTSEQPVTPTTASDGAGRASNPLLSGTIQSQCVCSGWLNKEGGKIKTWKRRYFSLNGTTLRYFKSESGSLLRSLTITRVDERPALPLGLEVTTTTGRKLILTAESKEDFAKWFSGMQDALKAAADGAPGNSSSTTTTATAAMTAAVAEKPLVESSILSKVATKVATKIATALDTTATTTTAVAADAGRVSAVSATVNSEGKTVTAYSGWLEKEGQRFKTWKKRYFTYKKGALLYFNEVGGVARGHGVVTSVQVDTSKDFTLLIQLENERMLRVSAVSADEMDTWLKVLATDKPLLPPSSPAKAQEEASSRKSEQESDVVNRSSTVSSSQSYADKTQGGAVATAVVGRGEARERISDRLDPNDYLTNDTISNESFLRIQEGQPDASFLQASFNAGHHRSFKGDLNFSRPSDAKNGGLDDDEETKQAIRVDSAEDLEYYRSLLAESELEREKREAEKEAGVNNVNSCAACCIVM